MLYDVLSSADPSDFLFGPLATCVETDDGSDLVATDSIDPGPGGLSAYLVRANQSCGAGSVGVASGGVPRLVRDCP